MTTHGPVLTDALLKDALDRRGRGTRTSVELVDEVRTAIDAMPQSRGWTLKFAPAGVPLVASALLMTTIIGLAVVVGGSVPTPPPAPVPTDGGDIAYVQATYSWDGSRDDVGADPQVSLVDNPRILIQPSAGGAATVLAPLPGWDGPRAPVGGTVGPAVQWSPDGSRLAFYLPGETAGIYVMSRDGTDVTRLVDQSVPDWEPVDPGAVYFAWSPDGDQIAFAQPTTRNEGALPAGLYLVDVDDGRFTLLTNDTSYGLALNPVVWSPDGTQIAFARSEGPLRDATHGVFVISADGSDERRLAEVVDADLWGIGWSPDGSQIAFMRSDSLPDRGDDLGGVWIIKADGTGPRRISSGPEYGATEIQVVFALPVFWSPDGRWVDVPEIDDPDGGIVLVAVDGSGERNVGAGMTIVHHSWSPDWSQVAFSDRGGAASEDPPTWDSPNLYVMNADGAGRRWLADGEYPDWSR